MGFSTMSDYAYPKMKGIPQPRYAVLGKGEMHFDPLFVASTEFPDFWKNLTGKDFPPASEWPDA